MDKRTPSTDIRAWVLRHHYGITVQPAAAFNSFTAGPQCTSIQSRLQPYTSDCLDMVALAWDPNRPKLEVIPEVLEVNQYIVYDDSVLDESDYFQYEDEDADSFVEEKEVHPVKKAFTKIASFFKTLFD